MKDIKSIAREINLNEKDIFCYGNYMAKITKKCNEKRGKLILLTAVNPTPYGEGKTTVSIGLNDALKKLDKNSIAVLREPSLGPVFGMKGGAIGGGKSCMIPSEEIDLHFTGDFHAITSANNLLAAAIDNHIFQGNELNIDENKICFKRCLDMNDRTLRDKFNITAASELMAIFCLAKDELDLKMKIDNILIAYSKDGKAIYAKSLNVTNAMVKLLKMAMYPNLVQSLEENPIIVHGGPFANIAHGCSSVTSLNLGLSISDYVITEAGFGSDLGCEKFVDILGKHYDLNPNYIVLIATCRAFKYNGCKNLLLHINNLKKFNIPFCVTINEFLDDTEEDFKLIEDICKNENVVCIRNNVYSEGGSGALELARYITSLNLFDTEPNYVYSDSDSLKEKIEKLVNNVYLIPKVNFTKEAMDVINNFKSNEEFSVCMAKTQYAYKDDVKEVTVKNIEIHTGSKLIVVLLDNIITMPGLPKSPRYLEM